MTSEGILGEYTEETAKKSKDESYEEEILDVTFRKRPLEGSSEKNFL